MSAPRRSAAETTRALVRKLAVTAGVAFFLGFGLVPLYEIACEKVFGIRLGDQATAATDVATMAVDRTRLVTVQFDASVNSGLGWTFGPKLHSIQVHPGELTEVWYEVRNTTEGSVVGNAVPSVAPSAASMYFNKTECFCFTEQRLDAGEARDMPVRFVIDPHLPPEVQTVTLGYVFFRNDAATRQLANAAVVVPPAS